ncbi:cytochrome C [Faecalibacterium prausnitzii]|jgi:ABC-type transport system substrate-binding protein|uniref:cytochrome C n=1 Tax=Faecalibacterium prausnitzii TaxID=853 RepID=UPI001CBFA414|nr:cytochrome C [Faecalibacterium prausnitzii]MBS6698876.1 cytochrome C [Faecalibacterium prausnitzii]
MKLKNAAVVAAALALAVGMTACGSSSSSTAASSTASSVASSVAASSEAASSEAVVEPAEYTVYNTTGSTVSELYLYVAGSEDKGENLAGEGLADGENVVLTLPEDADQSAKYVLEFTTEDGTTQSFDTLSYEVAPISLLSADAAAGATPISFTAPEK